MIVAKLCVYRDGPGVLSVVVERGDRFASVHLLPRYPFRDEWGLANEIGTRTQRKVLSLGPMARLVWGR